MSKEYNLEKDKKILKIINRLQEKETFKNGIAIKSPILSINPLPNGDESPGIACTFLPKEFLFKNQIQILSKKLKSQIQTTFFEGEYSSIFKFSEELHNLLIKKKKNLVYLTKVGPAAMFIYSNTFLGSTALNISMLYELDSLEINPETFIIKINIKGSSGKTIVISLKNKRQLKSLLDSQYLLPSTKILYKKKIEETIIKNFSLEKADKIIKKFGLSKYTDEEKLKILVN